MAEKERFSLANRNHLELFLGLLVAQGAMCPKCGTGTRVTSRRWARCKNERCGERVKRHDLSELAERRQESEPEGTASASKEGA